VQIRCFHEHEFSLGVLVQVYIILGVSIRVQVFHFWYIILGVQVFQFECFNLSVPGISTSTTYNLITLWPNQHKTIMHSYTCAHTHSHSLTHTHTHTHTHTQTNYIYNGRVSCFTHYDTPRVARSGAPTANRSRSRSRSRLRSCSRLRLLKKNI